MKKRKETKHISKKISFNKTYSFKKDKNEKEKKCLSTQYI